MKNQNQSINIENQTIIFEPVTPHPEPVIIGELLTEIEAVIKRHVVLSDHAATALAVWVLHTYVYEVRDTVAYVAIESPEKRCGKTTLLSVLAAMANKQLIASNVTVGALFRAIDTCRPTLFIDEADTFLAGSGTMRGIINSGNTWRTAYVLRLSRAKSQQSRDRLPSVALAKEGEGAGTRQDGESSPQPENIDSGLKRYICRYIAATCRYMPLHFLLRVVFGLVRVSSPRLLQSIFRTGYAAFESGSSASPESAASQSFQYCSGLSCCY